MLGILNVIALLICIQLFLRASELTEPSRWESKWTWTRVVAFPVGLFAVFCGYLVLRDLGEMA